MTKMATNATTEVAAEVADIVTITVGARRARAVMDPATNPHRA